MIKFKFISSQGGTCLHIDDSFKLSKTYPVGVENIDIVEERIKRNIGM